MAECQYVRGTCSHPECEAWGQPGSIEPEPRQTIEEACEATGHAYYADDGAPPHGRGRCYCGQRFYPPGGPDSSQPAVSPGQGPHPDSAFVADSP